MYLEHESVIASPGGRPSDILQAARQLVPYQMRPYQPSLERRQINTTLFRGSRFLNALLFAVQASIVNNNKWCDGGRVINCLRKSEYLGLRRLQLPESPCCLLDTGVPPKLLNATIFSFQTQRYQTHYSTAFCCLRSRSVHLEAPKLLASKMKHSQP